MIAQQLRVNLLALGALSAALLVGCSDDGAAGPTGPPATASATASASGTGERSAGAAPAPGSRQVAAAVKAFYERYAADPSAEDNRRFLTDAAAKAVFAPGGNADRVLCAQNVPSSMSFGAPVMGATEATVVVTTHWNGSADRQITVTVALPDIVISSIACPHA